MSSHHFRPSLKCQECLWSRVSGISELAQSHGTGSLRMFVTGSDRSFKTGLRPVSAFERRARTAGHGANADGGRSTMRCARATRSAPLSTSAWIASIAVKWGSRRAHPEGNRCFAEHCREWEHSRQVGACSVPLGLSPSAEGSRRRARESWMTSARRAMHTECSRGRSHRLLRFGAWAKQEAPATRSAARAVGICWWALVRCGGEPTRSTCCARPGRGASRRSG